MAKPNKHIAQYTAKNGRQQFKPSIQLAMEMNNNQEGFCLACGEVNSNVEPDVRRGTCQCCGEPKVYGAEEIALMGLTFDASTRPRA